MIRSNTRATLVALAALLALAGCSRGAKTLARVGSRTLTTDDFIAAARGNEAQYPVPPQQAREMILRDLVRREMMLEAVHERGTDTTVFAKNFLASLKERHVLTALYARLTPRDPGVSVAEARRFYSWRNEKADAHLIYAIDRRTVDAARAELGRGEPFGQVADRFNMPGAMPPGGAIGQVVPGSLIPPLDDALRTLPIGRIGGPYETAQGWFLLEVTSRAPNAQPAFEVEQSQLTEMIRQRKQREAFANALAELKDAWHARIEPDAPALVFQALTPARMGELSMPPIAPEMAARVLARWDGGTYTLADAIDDLRRPDLQKPAASLTPAIQAWLQSRLLTRVSWAEARKRHLEEEPEVARRIRTEFERYLLEGEYASATAGVPPPGEDQMRAIWEAVKGQYPQAPQRYEDLSPDMRSALASNAEQMAREQRFNQYADSLERALQPAVFAENLRSVPWPVPSTAVVTP